MTEPAQTGPDATLAAAVPSRAIEDRLVRAEQLCTRRGARLTDIRRNVLRLILESGEPLGAYTLLDALRSRHGSGKPPTIYRALDFLLAQGLVHRVERLNAFISCHDDGGHHHHHAAQFLICRLCGRVTEIEDTSAEAAILAAAGAMGFHPDKVVVEVEGTCGACAALN
jgi:Fur family zinc uptake transcriptional regulator